MLEFSDPTQIQREPEVMASRRAHPVAQALLGGEALRVYSADSTVGWFGSDVIPETGAIALVREGSDHEELVGEVIRVRWVVGAAERSVYAYVVGALAIEEDVDLSLSRRCFLDLALLSQETLEAATVEVIA